MRLNDASVLMDEELSALGSVEILIDNRNFE